MSNKSLALAALATLGLATSASAGTATSTFQVTAIINPTCSVVSTTNLALGTIGGTSTAYSDFTPSTVTMNCSAGLTYGITLASGNPGGATNFQMVNGTSNLAYQLYANSFGNPQWDATAGGTYSSTGTGVNQAIGVYGKIPAQAAPVGGWTVGTYTDTVTMTVTW